MWTTLPVLALVQSGSSLTFGTDPTEPLTRLPRVPLPLRIEILPPSIVFAHGLWADGSCFSKVIELLVADGYEVISTQNHLNTVADDAAAVRTSLGRAKGPVVLVGHSYGGTVITDPPLTSSTTLAAGGFGLVAGQCQQQRRRPDPETANRFGLRQILEIVANLVSDPQRLAVVPQCLLRFRGRARKRGADPQRHLKGRRRLAAEDVQRLILLAEPLQAPRELVDLRWDQIGFETSSMAVRRAKKGTPSTHPIRGDEMRALRKLQREQEPKSPFVFTSERGAPFSTAGFARLVERAEGEGATQTHDR